MKNFATILSLLLFLLFTQVSAQQTNWKERTKIEIEIVKNGIPEKAIGYFIGFDMKNLKTPYTAIVIEKHFIENTKKAILYFPMEDGRQSKYEVEDVSEYLFTTQSNNLAIIRLGELASDMEYQTIYSNVVFVPEESISDFSFSLDKVKLREIKLSWEKSMMTR